MKYILYKATSPNGRCYIGITNNFKRRLKEHGSSKFAFGHALRKYGKHNFTFEFECFDSPEEALAREAELVTLETIKAGNLYNETIGGSWSDVLQGDNPMHRPEVLANHPNIWSTTNNPMNNPESKQKMIDAQYRRAVSIDGVVYSGVREACRQLGTYRQFMIHRMKSSNYPTWYYVS